MLNNIIYEDDYLLVYHKQAGIATQTGKIGAQDVESILKNHIYSHNGVSPYLGVVHRLDQPVEGLLVFAKNKSCAANLTKQLEQGSLNKYYYAAIAGSPTSFKGRLTDYLWKEGDRARVVSEKEAHNRQAKESVLEYVLVKTIHLKEEEQDISLLDIQLETGRFHQIRAQLANAGMALLGDKKYGGEVEVRLSQRLAISHTALCAYKIGFEHPITKKRMDFSVEPTGKVFSYFKNFDL